MSQILWFVFISSSLLWHTQITLIMPQHKSALSHSEIHRLQHSDNDHHKDHLSVNIHNAAWWSTCTLIRSPINQYETPLSVCWNKTNNFSNLFLIGTLGNNCVWLTYQKAFFKCFFIVIVINMWNMRSKCFFPKNKEYKEKTLEYLFSFIRSKIDLKHDDCQAYGLTTNVEIK